MSHVCLLRKGEKQRREMNADQFSLKVLGNSSKFTWSLYQLFPPFPEYTIFSGGAEIPPKCAKVLWTKSGKRGKIDPFSCSKSEMTFLEDRSSERKEVTHLKIELRTVIRSVWLLFYSLNNVYKHTCVHTSYLSFLLHMQDFWIPNCTPQTTKYIQKILQENHNKVRYAYFNLESFTPGQGGRSLRT